MSPFTNASSPADGRFVHANASSMPDSPRVNVNTFQLVSRVTDKLLSLRTLQDGWDGYGAVRPDTYVLEYAAELFAQIARPNLKAPAVVPTVDGGIQFEWHTATYHVEIEIPEHGRFIVFRQNRQTGASNQHEGSDVAVASAFVKVATVAE